MTKGSGRTDVSANVVVDFDHHSDEFNLNEMRINAELRRQCPVARNENYGGFWFVTSYDAVAQIARDGDTFAHNTSRTHPMASTTRAKWVSHVPKANPPSESAKSTVPITRP
jgi:cytochrome P450